MRETNIASLDLNLVPALEALLRRRNVTLAAADVGLSQPAMSRALARLREVQDDPLLVRRRGGYGLTPRALAIQPHLAQALRHLRDVFTPPVFDPANERRLVRLAAADTHTVLLMPGLMTRLTRAAPGVEVRVEPYGPDVMARLDAGSLDLTFALASTPLPPGAQSEHVGTDRLALVMARSHPLAGRPWTIADYGAVDHVVVALVGDGHSEIDALLAAAGVSRRIALATPHFMAALATVGETRMVTTVSRALARRFAGSFDLVLKEPPLERTALAMTLVCSHIRASDPFLAWFRHLIREVATDVLAEPSDPV